MRLFLFALLSCLLGCGQELGHLWPEIKRDCADVMYDSLGSPFHNDSGRPCFPFAGAGSPTGDRGEGECTDGDNPGVMFDYDRFFAACPSCGNRWSPADCRPLVCETDKDCPVFSETRSDDDEKTKREYECRNSLCQNADTDLFPLEYVEYRDASLLCLAEVERVDDQYEGEPACPGVDPHSGEPCPLPLPEACLQP
jgi:hypothetical protein